MIASGDSEFNSRFGRGAYRLIQGVCSTLHFAQHSVGAKSASLQDAARGALVGERGLRPPKNGEDRYASL
jgi:hypothetical protein